MEVSRGKDSLSVFPNTVAVVEFTKQQYKDAYSFFVNIERDPLHPLPFPSFVKCFRASLDNAFVIYFHWFLCRRPRSYTQHINIK